jgi:hypothetical protein
MNRTYLRCIARSAIALAMIAAGLAAATAPAQAAIPNTLVNEHTERCLADFFDGGASSVGCVTGGVGQQWVDRIPSAPHRYQFKNRHTGRCLADFFDGGLSSVDCVTGGVGQEWEPLTSYPQQLRNTHTKRCLQDAFDGGPGTVPCNLTAPVTDLQLWK